MAELAGRGASHPTVRIVYMEAPQEEQTEAFHIRTLASVLVSEETSKEALIYSYKTAASGFSAKLTPKQVAEISTSPSSELKGFMCFVYKSLADVIGSYSKWISIFQNSARTFL